MLQSAMQMFVARFASRPAICLYEHYRLRGQPAGLSTPHDDRAIMLRSRWHFWGGSPRQHAVGGTA